VDIKIHSVPDLNPGILSYFPKKNYCIDFLRANGVGVERELPWIFEWTLETLKNAFLRRSTHPSESVFRVLLFPHIMTKYLLK
jgi:hypothetical protein